MNNNYDENNSNHEIENNHTHQIATVIKNTERKECRYCLSGDRKENLINPCQCEGTMKYVHQQCLEEWIKNGNKTITELRINQGFNVYAQSDTIYMTLCEICKYQMRFTKYFKNNLVKSIYKLIKNLFGSFKNVFNLILHLVILIFLIKRLRMFFDELMSLFKRCSNFLNPSFWINLTHNITVLTSIMVALNDIYCFYCNLLMTKRKCLISFLPRLEKIDDKKI